MKSITAVLFAITMIVALQCTPGALATEPRHHHHHGHHDHHHHGHHDH
ncbi:hypothetical protein TNIN_340521, partial [Trichonephila inaurata madagascariensis]